MIGSHPTSRGPGWSRRAPDDRTVRRSRARSRSTVARSNAVCCVSRDRSSRTARRRCSASSPTTTVQTTASKTSAPIAASTRRRRDRRRRSGGSAEGGGRSVPCASSTAGGMPRAYGVHHCRQRHAYTESPVVGDRTSRPKRGEMVDEARDSSWQVMRRRWRVVAAVTLVVAATTGIVSSLLTPVYSSTATLVVNQPPGGAANLDIASSLQFYARTLVNLVGSDNVAKQVIPKLSFAVTPSQARSEMSFQTINETQLIEVTATDSSAHRAQDLANAWATTFTAYAAEHLKEVAPGSLSVADTASLPDSPVRPRPKLYAAIGLVLGLMLGIGAAFLRERLDNRIQSTEHLTKLFGLPVLATLPRRGSSPADAEHFREAVGLLRTNLQFSSDEPL